MSISDRISKINQVRKQLVVLPISKLQVEMKPATTNEDNVRKLMDSDPYGYTEHLLKLIWQCIDFSNAKDFSKSVDGVAINIPKGKTKPDFKDFVNNIAFYDREMLFWALAKSTYGEKLYVDTTPCPNEKCKHVYPTDITCSKLMDSVEITWDKTTPFQDFLYPAIYDDVESGIKYTCHMKLLSLGDELTLSTNVDESDAKENFNHYGNIYTPLEQFKISVKKIEIESLTVDKNDPEYFHEVEENQSEILKAVSNFNKQVIDEIVNIYFANVLSKYQYFFKQQRTCPKCNEQHDLNFPMFVFFFQRFRTV